MYVYQCVSMSRCLQSLLSHTPVCTAAGEKMALFESATRVPLLIRAPWLPRSVGAISTQVVELVSLYRTLAELAGVQEVEASVKHFVDGVMENIHRTTGSMDGRDVKRLKDCFRKELNGKKKELDEASKELGSTAMDLAKSGMLMGYCYEGMPLDHE